MRHLVRIAACAASLTACASQASRSEPPQQAQLTRAVSPPARLEPPASIPAPARAILQTRMASHARDMGDLMTAIVVLDYPRIRSGARAIAADASLARPLTGDATELNSMLPEAFFQHQDALRAEARALAAAAAAQSALAVADSYGRLSETCVRCHAAYREGK